LREILKKIPTMPPNSWLLNQVLDSIKDGGDYQIVTTARNGKTNIGKSTFNLWLALHLNPQIDIEAQVFFDSSKWRDAYYSADPSSGLVLLKEEAESAHKRRSMQKENVKTSQMWQEGRINQIISILSLPNVRSFDRELRELCDAWCNIERKGAARIHGKYMPDYNSGLYHPQKEVLHFPNLEDSPQYQQMEAKKLEHFQRNRGAEEEEEGEQSTGERNYKIVKLYNQEGLTQKEIAEEYGVTQQHISNILNGR